MFIAEFQNMFIIPIAEIFCVCVSILVMYKQLRIKEITFNFWWRQERRVDEKMASTVEIRSCKFNARALPFLSFLSLTFSRYQNLSLFSVCRLLSLFSLQLSLAVSSLSVVALQKISPVSPFSIAVPQKKTSPLFSYLPHHQPSPLLPFLFCPEPPF